MDDDGLGRSDVYLWFFLSSDLPALIPAADFLEEVT